MARTRSASLKDAGRSVISADGDRLSGAQISSAVEEALATTDFIDIHTHLYPPAFGKLGLWGIDELLTYHYLEAEFFRNSRTKPAEYWELTKGEQADAIWQALFVANTPVSEATRGVVAVLEALGLPTGSSNLSQAREFFKSQNIETHVANVLRMAGVSTAIMTNDPLDPEEAALWRKKVSPHPQFSGRFASGQNSLYLADELAGPRQPGL